MNRTLKMRLTAFGLAIAVLAFLIGWAAYATWSEVGQLQARLSKEHLRSFEIADHLQDEILALNNDLVRYDLKSNPDDLAEFQRSSAALNDWIDQQKPLLRSQRELDLLNKIDSTYDLFLAAATNGLSRANRGEQDKLNHIDTVQDVTHTLWELGFSLEEAHRLVLEESLAAAQRSVSVLRWVIFGALLLLLSSLVWLSFTVYGEMITPLQLKLVETHAILERQEKLASLGVLAAGVAHEIRNPLTAIKARLFSHQRALDKGTPEFEDVVIIGDELNRLERIVKEFLQFARPSEPHFVEMNAEQPLREVRDLLAPQYEKQSIQFKLEVLTTNRFRADPQQIKQVLINFVQNAAESIERSGTIILRARDGDMAQNGRYRPAVILETVDTGRGIPADVQKRLFDPFFSTKEAGTGLGLAIAARIVEKHGGLVEFQTQPNRGATFGVVLPAC